MGQTRRRLLTTCACLATGLAGCGGTQSDSGRLLEVTGLEQGGANKYVLVADHITDHEQIGKFDTIHPNQGPDDTDRVHANVSQGTDVWEVHNLHAALLEEEITTDPSLETLADEGVFTRQVTDASSGYRRLASEIDTE